MEPKEKIIDVNAARNYDKAAIDEPNIWARKEQAEFLKNYQKQKQIQYPPDPRMTDRQKLNFIVTVIIIFLLILVFLAFASVAWNYFQNKQLSEIL